MGALLATLRASAWPNSTTIALDSAGERDMRARNRRIGNQITVPPLRKDTRAQDLLPVSRAISP
jgi:hypothetical protein